VQKRLFAKSSPQDSLNNPRGQIVVEYVLLLVIGVSIAMLITSTMVSRNPDNPGFLIKKWLDIIQTIGADMADDLKPEPPGP
jgi:hypothetical protein